MATFTGLGESHNDGQSCENVTKFQFISPIPPGKPTSMYPNTMVLKTTFAYLSKAKNRASKPHLVQLLW